VTDGMKQAVENEGPKKDYYLLLNHVSHLVLDITLL
jgi:hypothetical protein